MATHIIVMDCADDTEKKRVRYVIDKWGGEGEGKGRDEVSEVKAIVVKADLDEGEVGDFLEELYSKISAGRGFIFSKKNSTLREHRCLSDNFFEKKIRNNESPHSKLRGILDRFWQNNLKEVKL